MIHRVLGLIINPVAGIGGRVGLKGSDGLAVQQKALALGAVPESIDRAVQALEVLRSSKTPIEIMTYPDEMGEAAARRCGFDPIVMGSITSGATTAEDTRRAAQAMKQSGVDLLLFAGGDGTARDIYAAINTDLPTLGIPAGVKIHSAVFAINPRSAGELAAEYLQSRSVRLHEAEVMDLDEDAYRSGVVAAKLYGYLKIPYKRQLVQNQKVPTPAAEAAMAEAIAYAIVEQMEPDCLYILGPGTTARSIAARLGVSKTLVGVDVVTREGVVSLDVGESDLLKLIEGQRAKIIVTPIGGQGFLFGRGNQQIGPRVIQKVGKDNIMVVSTSNKLNVLGGRPLLVDTGDLIVDAMLSGYVSITTGYHERVIYRVA